MSEWLNFNFSAFRALQSCRRHICPLWQLTERIGRQRQRHWEWFSDIVTQLTFSDKLQNWNSCDALFKTWYCSTPQPDQEQPHPKGNTARRLCRPSESSSLCQTYDWESQVFQPPDTCICKYMPGRGRGRGGYIHTEAFSSFDLFQFFWGIGYRDCLLVCFSEGYKKEKQGRGL